ncbi:MAG TPA: asparaginase, partial [Longimicrobiales bacterium]|nr:asparaginase [Longimicrobiales bacterium]
MERFDIRVEVTRGEWVESSHGVHAVALDADGTVRARAGDPDTFVFARSSVKPVQAMPLVEDGVVDALGLTEEELALCCAS